jgi:hypothetical protein
LVRVLAAGAEGAVTTCRHQRINETVRDIEGSSALFREHSVNIWLEKLLAIRVVVIDDFGLTVRPDPNLKILVVASWVFVEPMTFQETMGIPNADPRLFRLRKCIRAGHSTTFNSDRAP